MLSLDFQRILSENGYSFNDRNEQITISNAKKPIGIYLFLFVILALSIPILLIYIHPIAALTSGMIAIIPAYGLLKRTEVPDSVTINFEKKSINILSISGFSNKTLHFSQIENVMIRSIQETHEASAMKEEIASMIYYLCINLKSKSVDLFRFTESPKEDLLLLKQELLTVIQQPV